MYNRFNTVRRPIMVTFFQKQQQQQRQLKINSKNKSV